MNIVKTNLITKTIDPVVGLNLPKEYVDEFSIKINKLKFTLKIKDFVLLYYTDTEGNLIYNNNDLLTRDKNNLPIVDKLITSKDGFDISNSDIKEIMENNFYVETYGKKFAPNPLAIKHAFTYTITISSENKELFHDDCYFGFGEYVYFINNRLNNVSNAYRFSLQNNCLTSLIRTLCYKAIVDVENREKYDSFLNIIIPILHSHTDNSETDIRNIIVRLSYNYNTPQLSAIIRTNKDSIESILYSFKEKITDDYYKNSSINYRNRTWLTPEEIYEKLK